MPDDSRILRGTPATVSGTFADQYGEPAAAAGTVTVHVTRADGTDVLAAGTATATGASTGVHTVAVPVTETSTLDVLKAVWTDDGNDATVTTYHETVGGYYATVADVRTHDKVLEDRARYTDAQIRAARQLVEEEFEGICGRAFVPRFRRARLRVQGSSLLVLPEPDLIAVQSVHTVAGDGTLTPMDSATVAAIEADRDGVARISGSWPAVELIVAWETGKPAPPGDVLGAFHTRIRDVLNRDNRGVPDRTSSFTSAENGTFSLIVPGQRGSITGIGDVDVVLKRYGSEALVA